MLSVMVCPSLKPKSSFGPESTRWAFLLISFSCFTHLQGGRDTKIRTISTYTQTNNASQQFPKKTQTVQYTVQYCISQRQHFVLAWTACAAEGCRTAGHVKQVVNYLEGKLMVVCMSDVQSHMY